MKKCEHTLTQGREGQTGWWCRACGVKVYEVEPRECRGCRWFRDMGSHQIPICQHHMMGVTRDMHVMFAVAKGTCFTE